VLPAVRPQQMILWAEERRDTDSSKKIPGLFTDGRCSQSICYFPRTADVGTGVPAAVEEKVQRDTSEGGAGETEEAAEVWDGSGTEET
jgi:hypothetical protein